MEEQPDPAPDDLCQWPQHQHRCKRIGIFSAGLRHQCAENKNQSPDPKEKNATSGCYQHQFADIIIHFLSAYAGGFPLAVLHAEPAVYADFIIKNVSTSASTVGRFVASSFKPWKSTVLR